MDEHNEDGLELLPYRELQQRTKALSLPSNVKKVHLLEMLRAKLYKTQADLDHIVHRVKSQRQKNTEVSSSTDLTSSVGLSHTSVRNRNTRKSISKDWDIPSNSSAIIPRSRRILQKENGSSNNVPQSSKDLNQKPCKYVSLLIPIDSKDGLVSLQNSQDSRQDLTKELVPQNSKQVVVTTKDGLVYLKNSRLDSTTSRQTRTKVAAISPENESNDATYLQTTKETSLRSQSSISRGEGKAFISTFSGKKESASTHSLQCAIQSARSVPVRNCDRVLRSKIIKPNYCLLNDGFHSLEEIPQKVITESQSSKNSQQDNSAQFQVKKVESKSLGYKRVEPSADLGPPNKIRRTICTVNRTTYAYTKTMSIRDTNGNDTKINAMMIVQRPEPNVTHNNMIIGNQTAKYPSITYSKRQNFDVDAVARSLNHTNTSKSIARIRKTKSEAWGPITYSKRQTFDVDAVARSLNHTNAPKSDGQIRKTESKAWGPITYSKRQTFDVDAVSRSLNHTNALKSNGQIVKTESEAWGPTTYSKRQTIDVDTVARSLNHTNPPKSNEHIRKTKSEAWGLTREERVLKPRQNSQEAKSKVAVTAQDCNNNVDIATPRNGAHNFSEVLTDDEIIDVNSIVDYPLPISKDTIKNLYPNLTVLNEVDGDVFPNSTSVNIILGSKQQKLASNEVFGINVPNMTESNGVVDKYFSKSASDGIIDSNNVNLTSSDENIDKNCPNIAIIDKNFPKSASDGTIDYVNLTSTDDNIDKNCPNLSIVDKNYPKLSISVENVDTLNDYDDIDQISPILKPSIKTGIKVKQNGGSNTGIDDPFKLDEGVLQTQESVGLSQISDKESSENTQSYNDCCQKKMNTEQIRSNDVSTSVSSPSQLPPIATAFPQLLRWNVTSPLYVQVTEESDRLLIYPAVNTNEGSCTTYLDILYNYPRSLLTHEPFDKHQRLRTTQRNTSLCTTVSSTQFDVIPTQSITRCIASWRPHQAVARPEQVHAGLQPLQYQFVNPPRQLDSDVEHAQDLMCGTQYDDSGLETQGDPYNGNGSQDDLQDATITQSQVSMLSNESHSSVDTQFTPAETLNTDPMSVDTQFTPAETLDTDPTSVDTQCTPAETLDTVPRQELEDANDRISQDENIFEIADMDISMQCILCCWTGYKISLENHIRKEHGDEIIKSPVNEWNITFRLGTLVNQAVWLSQVVEYNTLLYVLSVKYDEPGRYRAAISMVSPDPNPKSGSVTMYNKVSGQPFVWRDAIPTIDSNMPFGNDNPCLSLPLSNIGIWPLNRSLVVGQDLNDIQVIVFVKIFY